MTKAEIWASEYSRTRDRVIALAESLTDAQCATVVPACPDWTVREVLAHLSGLAFALSTDNPPGADVQRWIDALVSARRGATVADVIAEWRMYTPPASSQLLYDAVAHEHDICHALGRTGDRESSSVTASLEPMTTLLARDLDAQGAGAIRLTAAGRTWTAGSGDTVAAIELPAFEMLRVFGSRRSERQLRALAWQGDFEAVLPALAHFPLPPDDIIE